MSGRGLVKSVRAAEHVVSGVNDTMRLEGFEPDGELTDRLMSIAMGDLSVEDAEQDLLKRLKTRYPDAFK